jgi:hypothetical protein
VRETVPAAKGLARTGDDRHTHPQRFAGRKSAVVGPGIQRDVDAMVTPERFLRRAPAVRLDPRFRDPMPGKHPPIARGRRLVFEPAIHQNHACVRQRPKNPSPHRHRLRRGLRYDVEAAKRDVACGAGGQRIYRRSVIWRIEADVIMRQPQHLLAIPALGFRRHLARVSQEVIHCRKARSPHVVEPGDLHRRGAAGKHREPVAGRVSGEIEEDVDAIRANLPGELRVRERRRLTPEMRRRAPALRHRIWLSRIGIADDGERRTIEVLQRANEKPPHGMPGKMRRDETHPDRSGRIARRKHAAFRQRRRVQSVVFAMSAVKFFERGRRVVVQSREVFPARGSRARLLLETAPEAGDRLVEFTMVLQVDGEIAEKLRLVGSAARYAAIASPSRPSV